jgi:hypothetical protein
MMSASVGELNTGSLDLNGSPVVTATVSRTGSSIRRASQLMEAFMCTPIPVARMRG